MNTEKLCQNTGELTDAATLLQIAVEKMRCLIDDVSQEYFDQYDPNEKEDVPYIIYAFNKQRVRMDMLVDYLYEVEKKTDYIYDNLLRQYDDCKKQLQP